MKKPQFKHLATVLAISLLLGTAFMLVVQAQTPTSTFWISSGIYPSGPSYTVWMEGSNYFAKLDNGQLATSGTNFSLVLQTVFTALHAGDGGSILIKAHDSAYMMDSTVQVYGEILLEGEILSGSAGTTGGVILQLADNADCDMFLWNSTGTEHWFTMRNLQLYGNRFNQGAVISNGFVVSDNAGGDARDFTFDRVWIRSFKGDGLISDQAWGWRISQCSFETNDYDGCDFIAGSSMNIEGSQFGGNLGIGLRLNASETRVMGCDIFNNKLVGIRIEGTSNYIAYNNFFGNGWFGNFTYDAIYVYKGTGDEPADGNQIIANKINGYHAGTYAAAGLYNRHGIKLGNVLVYNTTISSNTIQNVVNETIVDDGTGSVIFHNIGFTSLLDYASGTSYPSDPVIGQRFYRTDLFAFYIWNSTHWVVTGTGATGPAGPAGTLEGQQPYDYLVFINATNTYMINGTTAAIDFEGDPNDVINNALGNGTNVLLASGTYELDDDIGISINGAGRTLKGMDYGTVITCAAGFDDHVIHVTADYATISNLRIDGTNQASSFHGILEDGNGNGGLFVHHVTIEDCGSDGIRLGDLDGSWEGNWGKIHHVIIRNNGQYGVFFTYDATDSEFMDMLISGHDGVSDAGIRIECDNLRITTGHLWGNEYEIMIGVTNSVRGLIVSNLGIMDGGGQGQDRVMHTSAFDFRGSTFVGCEFWVAKLVGIDQYDGLSLTGDTWGISVVGCVFRGDNEGGTQHGRYGIDLDASVHNMTIIGNVFHGFAQADPIETTGAQNITEFGNVVVDCG